MYIEVSHQEIQLQHKYSSVMAGGLVEHYEQPGCRRGTRPGYYSDEGYDEKSTSIDER